MAATSPQRLTDHLSTGQTYNTHTAMSRKTSRLSKRELLNRLLCLFEKSENKPLHVKDIFNAVGADKHPSKMLVIEMLTESY